MILSDKNDALQQLSSSDNGMIVIADLVERKLNIPPGEKLMVVKVIHQEIRPGGVLHKLVIEENQNGSTEGTWKDVREERTLHLKFLDEVSSPVQTSKEFKGKVGPLRLALFDASGDPVKIGPESSAEVEIVLIDATGNDKENDMSDGTFERSIIKVGEKKKPHFSRNVYVHLKEGEVDLINQKLGHDKDWTKALTCRLGARFVKNLTGLDVRKTWTAPFRVIDSRSQLYIKTPDLDSDVWRLKGLCRNGTPYKRLKKENIKTVRDFLFWHSVNPKGLQEVLGPGDKRLKTMVDHAQTCKIDDKRLYCHKSSAEPQMSVVYNSFGELKGLVDKYYFVPVDDLSAEKKDHARKLLSSVLEPSVFEERYETFFNDEASLLQQYPYKSSGVDASPNCLSQGISPTNIFDTFWPREVSGPIPEHENIDGNTLTFPDKEIQRSSPIGGEAAATGECVDDMNQRSGFCRQRIYTDSVWPNADDSPCWSDEEWRGIMSDTCMWQQPEEGASFVEKRPKFTSYLALSSFHEERRGIMSDTYMWQQPEEGASFFEKRPRTLKFRSVVKEVMSMYRLRLLMEPVLVPIIRRVVKEEVESALRKYIISATGTRIEGEGCTRLEVALIDWITGEVVSSGHGSSAKVEIVAREGDFDADGRDNWTLVEFQNKAHGNVYKKHHPPSLSDEVWHLEKIGKDGAFHKRLRKESVHTVEDFLLSLSLDPTRLRNILGAGMSAKMWEVTVEHARTCVLDPKLYFYGASQKNGVVFNIVGQVMGRISNGQYADADKLSETEKTEARQLVISAFADREKIVTFDEDTFPNFPTSSKSLSAVQSSSNLLSEISFHDDLSSSKVTGSSYLQQNSSSPDYMPSVYSINEGLRSFENCMHHDQHFDYPGQVDDSLLCYTGALNQAFCEDELQYFERDYGIQSPDLELSAYIPCSDISMDKAQRGWKILVFVLRWWFSIKRKLVARKTGI